MSRLCAVIESHSETAASLRLSRPIPALKKWAEELDYDALDPTDHGHIPFAVILVKEAEKWRQEVRSHPNDLVHF